MLLNFSLRQEPDPLLYQRLNDFDFDSGLDTALIESEMIRIMNESNGMGISANQVGFDKRVVVIKPSDKEAFALFNPKIINVSIEEVEDQEGCLSFPDLILNVYRPKEITVEYLDKHKQNCIITLKDYDARCLAHEIDHLNGICFTSKISSLKLSMARKRQRKIKNGRTK